MACVIQCIQLHVMLLPLFLPFLPTSFLSFLFLHSLLLSHFTYNLCLPGIFSILLFPTRILLPTVDCVESAIPLLDICAQKNQIECNCVVCRHHRWFVGPYNTQPNYWWGSWLAGVSDPQDGLDMPSFYDTDHQADLQVIDCSLIECNVSCIFCAYFHFGKSSVMIGTSNGWSSNPGRYSSSNLSFRKSLKIEQNSYHVVLYRSQPYLTHDCHLYWWFCVSLCLIISEFGNAAWKLHDSSKLGTFL